MIAFFDNMIVKHHSMEDILSFMISFHQKIKEYFHKVGFCESVIIYGAGEEGKKMAKEIWLLNVHKIAMWVDEKFESKKGFIIPVLSPNRIKEANYQKIIVTLKNSKIANEITFKLIEQGLPEEKIVLFWNENEEFI